MINNEYLPAKKFQLVKTEFNISLTDFTKWNSYNDILEYSEYKQILIIKQYVKLI